MLPQERSEHLHAPFGTNQKVKHAKRAVPVDPVHLRRTAINPADIGASLIGPVDIAHGQRDLRT